MWQGRSMSSGGRGKKRRQWRRLQLENLARRELLAADIPVAEAEPAEDLSRRRFLASAAEVSADAANAATDTDTDGTSTDVAFAANTCHLGLFVAPHP